jgi:catechol 2,3-dioxygenase
MGRAIKGLGEIALRVNDLGMMQRFYETVLGLEVMRRSENSVFFRITDGFGGHTQVLVLFDRSAKQGYHGLDAEKSTIDHIAFEISLDDFDAERKRLEQLGLRITVSEHEWVHWRSIYVHDPEGNEIELVCYDQTVV